MERTKIRRTVLIGVTCLVIYAALAHEIGEGLLAAAERQRGSPRAANAQSRTPHPPDRRGKLVEGVAGYKYLCFLPQAYGKQPKLWPLIIFLHGACRDEDLEKLKHFGPIKYALEHEDFPFVAIAPATSRGWSMDTLDTFVDRIQARFSVDRDRVYLTGHSMGGHATWRMAVAYPSRFAAIAPVSGAGNPREAAEKLRHVAVWVIHGEKDDVVPVKFGLAMIRGLKHSRREVKYTIYPDRGHDVLEPAYDNPELYEWFLQHRRYGSSPRTPTPGFRDAR